jgi:hypothetical protein
MHLFLQGHRRALFLGLVTKRSVSFSKRERLKERGMVLKVHHPINDGTQMREDRELER